VKQTYYARNNFQNSENLKKERGRMPANNYLKPEQKEKLQKALKREQSRDIREIIIGDELRRCL
jgi:hypothetical protein